MKTSILKSKDQKHPLYQLGLSDRFKMIQLRDDKGRSIVVGDKEKVFVRDMKNKDQRRRMMIEDENKKDEEEEEVDGDKTLQQNSQSDIISKAPSLLNNNDASSMFWFIICQKDGRGVSLENNFGQFLCSEPNGSVVANRPWVDMWELFHVIPIQSSISISEEEEGGGGSDNEENEKESKNVFCFFLRDFHGNFLSISPSSSQLCTNSLPNCCWYYSENDQILRLKVLDSEIISSLMENTDELLVAEEKNSKVNQDQTEQQKQQDFNFHNQSLTFSSQNKSSESINNTRSKFFGLDLSSLHVQALLTKMRRLQTMSFVQSYQSTYLTFNRKNLFPSLKYCVEFLQSHKDPLVPTLRWSFGDVCLICAEQFRKWIDLQKLSKKNEETTDDIHEDGEEEKTSQFQKEGLIYPDYFPLLCILRCVGRMLYFPLDNQRSDDYKDWALGFLLYNYYLRLGMIFPF